MKKFSLPLNVLYRSTLFILIAISVALIFNSISPRGIKLITPYRWVVVGDDIYKIPIFQPRKLMQKSIIETKGHTPDEIDLKSAYRHYAEDNALFIDTRTLEKYRLGHIPRAISIPMETFDYATPILTNTPKDQKIITYCDGEICSQSIDMAVYLDELGFSDVYFFVGGWLQWQENGFPLTEGDRP